MENPEPDISNTKAEHESKPTCLENILKKIEELRERLNHIIHIDWHLRMRIIEVLDTIKKMAVQTITKNIRRTLTTVSEILDKYENQSEEDQTQKDDNPFT